MRGKWLGFLSCLLSIPLCARLLDGISADSMRDALLAGTVLGLAYLLVRPLLRLLTFPIGCLTLGLSGFLIDCGLILCLARYVPGFHVAGPEWAALAALLVNVLCLVAGELQ